MNRLDLVLSAAIFLCILGFVVACVRMGFAQRDFLRLYDERINQGPPLSTEGRVEYYFERPARWLRDSPGIAGRSLDALWTPLADPVVERARRRAARRSLVPFSIIGLLMLVLFVPWQDL